MDNFFDPILHFIHPSTHIIAGGSQSGKTFYTTKIIKSLDKLIIPNVNNVVILFKEMQSDYLNMKEIDARICFIRGLDFSIENLKENTLVIIDDLMTECGKNKQVQELFTSGVHHKNISVIFLTQNLFNQGKFARDIRLNTHYFTIFKTPTFNSQVRYLGQQVFPETPRFLYEAYKQATLNPYSYLFISLHPLTADKIRVQSGILPGEDRVIYLPE